MNLDNKKFSIEEVWEILGEDNLTKQSLRGARKNNIQLGEYEIHPVSLRYLTFYQKGTDCVKCGRKGKYFKLKKDKQGPENRRHFNLYSEDDVLMVKGFIIPKSEGGREHISNMQTICERCCSKR